MNYKKGFTLIELLVVIAIIGILSSVVLASLNTARDKGADAAAKSNLNGARAQAELYYDGNGALGYTSVCTNLATGAGKQINAAKTAVGGVGGCVDTSAAWLGWVDLKSSTKIYCVDSSGYAGDVTATTSATTCS